MLLALNHENDAMDIDLILLYLSIGLFALIFGAIVFCLLSVIYDFTREKL